VQPAVRQTHCEWRYFHLNTNHYPFGYLINKSGSRRALDYLTTILEPQARTTNQSLAAAAGPLAAAVAEQDADLSKYAVMGLALSGNRKAAAALKSIRARRSRDRRMALPMAAVRASRPGSDVGEMLNEALRANEEIADKGLAEYYGGK